MNPPYPRDMAGYGRTPPDPRWPGDAVIAVQFVVNYEEGGENNTLHGDAASEAFLSEIVGAAPWSGQRHMNMESIYEYGARAGFWRLWRLFTARNIPVTVFGVATALERGPEQVAAMLEADWEIASHGLKWIEYKDFTRDEERAHMAQAIEIHTRVTGTRPLGWYTGRSSIHTNELVMENGGFLYGADSYADELPYWVESDKGPQLMVPYTLDANDMRFATPQGFNSGDQFFAYLKDSFDCLYAEGLAGEPKMMSIGLHCRLAGRPGRAVALARFLDYIQGFERVWTARRIDIARHWHEHHPFAGPNRAARTLPSEMDEESFVARFKDVFEHSPWIASRAFEQAAESPGAETPGDRSPVGGSPGDGSPGDGSPDDAPRGLPAEADSAEGLHRILCSVFRNTSRDERLTVLRAHPDLAGRLAQAGELTGDSTREQASAGLSNLSKSELQRFTELNRRYREKFGFPFIMAVKGYDKDEILDAFERRVTNKHETEFATACSEVERIALLRLKDMLP